MKQTVSLTRWSTDSEAPHHRLDLFAGLLSSLQAPVHLSASNRNFEAHLDAADLGTVLVVHQKGAPLSCRDDRHRRARDESRSYHLLLSLSTAWDVEHRGASHCEPGDTMLFDASLPWRISHAQPYEVINIKMSDAWLRQWVPCPAALVGRPIRGQSGWGRALASYVAQLSPNFFVDAPLPPSLIIDHLGALLALAASGLSGITVLPPSPALRSLAARIADCIEHRCFEPGLTAETVAQSIGVSVRTLHRCLAGEQRSFGDVLMSARAGAATRMLSSPTFNRFTLAEIARRAGFTHASHFSRVVRARTGSTPSEWRRRLGASTTADAIDRPEIGR